MPKLNQEYIKENLKEDKQGQILVIVGKQISGFDGIEDYVNSLKIYHLDLSFNKIRSITESLTFPKLLYLDLSTNLLTKIENLDALTSLQVLRLSRNRITKIEGLDKNINLNALDLSMNQISRIENIIHLKEIKILYLYGNKINTIEGLKNLSMLKELRIEQNNIENINHLSTYENNLEVLEAHSNKISNLDEVIVTLYHLRKLKKVSLFDNPISADVTYRFRILKNKNIENLDGLLVKEYIREVLEDMEEDYDLDQVVVKSQHNINELIDREREVKEVAIDILKNQITQLEDDFIDFSRSMEG
jgi:Leucine-rich repeat (LRR) protein